MYNNPYLSQEIWLRITIGD